MRGSTEHSFQSVRADVRPYDRDGEEYHFLRVRRGKDTTGTGGKARDVYLPIDLDVEAIPETVLLNKITRAKHPNEIDDVISTEAVERVTDGEVQQIQEKLGLMDDADRNSEGYNDEADLELEKLSLSEGNFEGAIVATDGGQPLDE